MSVLGSVRATALVREAGKSVRMLRTRTGILGQGMRFALAGGVVTLVYLTLTTVLSAIVGLPFQAALGIGFCAAITMHFTLQRMFVWIHHEEFALPLRHQVGRYLLVALTQYGVTVASTSQLPPVLGLPTEVVYLATAMLTLTVNFLVFRHRVFHAGSGALDPAGAVKA
jgi:putative flippase GtrA